MQIVDLIVYPIKSMGGISLASARLEARGITFDRRWMLVDDTGMFLSQRKYPQLALFKLAINQESLQVTNKSTGNTIDIPFTPGGQSLQVQIWDDKVEAAEVSSSISTWFSSELGVDVKLVFMPEETKRVVDQNYAHNSEVVSFADGYPLLITNTASLNDLNKRLEESISMSRFRPNVVVEGVIPFEEDDWEALLVGDQSIKLVKKCARCVMVDNDPQTAKKHGQVLTTLSAFRKQNNKVYFGINGLVSQAGELKIGDKVKAVKRTKTA